ncbi:MAG: AraC family transcriptional regulator ligand-binding domain-containing protein [Filomicrobium sp.]
MATAQSDTVPMITSGVVRAFRDSLKNDDVDFAELLNSVGITPAMVEEPLGFLPLSAVGELFDTVAELKNDDCLGLRLPLQLGPGSTGLLGHIAMTASSAREALALMAGYMSVFMTDVEAGYEEDYQTGLAVASWKYPETIVARRQLNYFTMTALLQRLRGAMGSQWSPLKIELESRRPLSCGYCSSQGLQVCEKLVRSALGTNVEFGCATNRVIHNIATLNFPMEHSNAEANKLHVDHARRAVAQMAYRFSVSERAKREIIGRLKHHDATLNHVAARLGLSSRVLQSQLHNEGTNFEELLTDCRRQIAERLIVETERPLSDIAYDLGYADPSVFSRAVRRWFNQSPRELRTQRRRGKPIT